MLMQRLPMRTLLALLVFGTAAGAAAQTYPNKPIRLVIAQTVGGNADFVARQFGERLAQRFGQQVVADNRPGGGGVIGPETVARAAADGYTLLLAPTSFGINPALHAKLPYDPMRDFAPISLLASSAAVVVVGPQIAARNIGELVALAKAQPGKLHFGSSGMASSNHLAGELFKFMAGVDTVHVPYKGAPPALVDLVSGRIQFMFASPPSVMSLVRSGKLKAIATTGTKRAAQLPDLPTVAESGVPGYQSTIWQSLLAPARTPAPILKRLHAEVADIARQPEVKERLIVDGSEAIGGTPQELADHISGEIARWTKVIKAIGLKQS
jgi:tripartite-type tricarboxylate transporter receptor subunit TctC